MEAQQPPGLARIATKYGLIDGAVAFLLFVIWALAGIRQNWTSTLISIALLVVLIVLAHRAFKKTHDGIMSYGQGLGLGTLLSLVGSALAAVLLFIYTGYIDPGYSAKALEIQRAAMEAQGVTGAQLDQGLAMTRTMLTPVGILVSSLVSGVIVGFICSLIVSAFTRCADPRAVI